MQEFICRDGRMSVNGICAIDQKNSRETYNTTKTIIDASKDNKVLDDLAQDGTPDYFPDLGKEKKSFSWDMDKPSKVEGFTKTISDNINAYNSFIEENLGIPSGVQTGMRVGASGYALASGGSLAAVLGPFALPFLFGGGLKKAGTGRVEKITNQDRQGENIAPIDMMTYDIPIVNQTGFNIHNDSYDGGNKNNNVGGGTFGDSVNDNSSFSDYS